MKINPEKLSETQLKEIKKILIIQQKPFGDILLNTGYFAELRRHFPKAQIDYLIQKPYKTILEDNKHLNNMVLMDKPKGKGVKYFWAIIKAILKIRKEKYDLVIDQLRGTSSMRFVLFSGIKYRLGWQYKKPLIRMGIKFNRWNWLYNLKAKKGPVRYYSRWKFDLLRPLGIEEVEHNIEYHVRNESFEYIKQWLKETDLDKEKIIGFTPGTPVKRKQWDLDYYAKLGDMITEQLNFKIVILWGPGEKEDAEYIQQKMKNQAIIALPTTFNEAGAFLHSIKVLICNDGGINHLAVSQEIPSIAIFGSSSNPEKWCASHKPIHLYLRDWNHKKSNDNTFNISPEMVFEKLKNFLDSPYYKG
ncbi:MAG: lipopolysaccharide heptosyltransferase family protein [Calditrichaeota bacterium]|nr:MAG: lipopolysaccharide heptosyltransferase family protein [Calditrichota bacterium]MBL1204528.1 lipopolysaccharide heptosyltransferase family protein [Calditrichota bacterium]NOG44356.1 glycosyltransferase family 9 protein [Calditrichota bacterium]